ncbi:MAG TPA: YbaK/EbsC family protein [Prolixibacteraceae bacterium]|nr:YbaK/EbsC family protein [Prolixibacteraceae bacterium]
MNVANIRKLLTDKGIEAEIIEHDRPIHSKNDAAGIFKIEETAPTLILDTDRGFLALIISGARERVDFKQLKKSMNCKKLQLANQAEIAEKFNITAGQVPLIGHNFPCILDEKLFQFPFVYGGTGDLYHTLKISPQQLECANDVILKIE